MLLDPFEEQLLLPAQFVKLGNGQSGKRKIVCQKDKAFLNCSVVIPDEAQLSGNVAKSAGQSAQWFDRSASRWLCRPDGSRADEIGDCPWSELRRRPNLAPRREAGRSRGNRGP